MEGVFRFGYPMLLDFAVATWGWEGYFSLPGATSGHFFFAKTKNFDGDADAPAGTEKPQRSLARRSCCSP